MSQYDGKYIKLPFEYTYWAVDDGRRTMVEDINHMHEIGIRPIVVVSLKELEAVPFAWESDLESDEEE